MSANGSWKVAAFEAVRDPEGGTSWRALEEPACLVSAGAHEFVAEPQGPGQKAYVDGHRVAGMALARPGSFILVRGSAGSTAYRYEGRFPVLEPGEGRPCAFSRTPIDGLAVRCPSRSTDGTMCAALVAESVAKEVGTCPACGNPIKTGEPPCPAEEALQ